MWGPSILPSTCPPSVASILRHRSPTAPEAGVVEKCPKGVRMRCGIPPVHPAAEGVGCLHARIAAARSRGGESGGGMARQGQAGGYVALFAPAYRASSFTSVMAVFIGSLDTLIIGS